MPLDTLSTIAHKRREVDDALQMQLSAFFSQWEQGVLVKVVDGPRCVIKRIPPPAGVKPEPRATIDISGQSLRIDWGKKWPL